MILVPVNTTYSLSLLCGLDFHSLKGLLLPNLKRVFISLLRPVDPATKPAPEPVAFVGSTARFRLDNNNCLCLYLYFWGARSL